MELHQDSMSLHVALAHIYSHDKSPLISYSELQWERKFSSRWTAELFSWVATEKHDKSKWMQKNGEETVAGRSQSNLWAPVASSKEIYTLLQKKGREGKCSSWVFLECRRILSCHGNNEYGTSCSQSVPYTLGALLKASWCTLLRWCCWWAINVVCSYS